MSIHKSIFIFAMAWALLLGAPASSLAQTKYETWGEVAAAMKVTFDKAIEDYGKGKSDEAYNWIDDAYFQFYEKEGFERNVKGRVSGKRVSAVEYKFLIIKQNIRKGEAFEKVKADIEILSTWCLEDAEKLDAKVAAKKQAQAAAAAAEAQALGPSEASQLAQADPQGQAETQTQGPSPSPQASLADQGLEEDGHDWDTFFYSFGTLVREGVEAILVIAAIAAYLLRMGNKKSVSVVYWSGLAALVVSALAAIALQYLLDLDGANQEIIEGSTMILATVVLFCVSNWMFSKAEAEVWKDYIQSKVQKAVTTGSAFALGAASFLAVFREGAETILFYQSILAQAGSDTSMVWYGFSVGCLVLVIVFLIIRHGTMKLPLKPFFMATSILMFIMSIVFVGGGIKELQEGNLIPVTLIEGFPTIEILKVYPTVQTLTPQLFLVALTILSIVIIHKRNRKFVAQQALSNG
ncbi:MAG: FTR1 family iron permease [Deltaproteobacteria bacterium]|jgi:FTR1 family protein|nr:FTR1 family iron permease [Deltaproteobacteria bacterium]